MNPATLSVTEWCELVGVAVTVLGAIGYIVRLYLRSNFVASDELDEHRDDLAKCTRRIEALEARTQGLATTADVNKVLTALERQNGDRRVLAAEGRARNLRSQLAELGQDLVDRDAALAQIADQLAQLGRQAVDGGRSGHVRSATGA